MINIYLFYSLIYLSKANNLKQLYSISEITITIKGSGTQQILSDYSGYCGSNKINFTNLPDTIIVNGISITINKYVEDLEEEYNNITMIWNNDLEDCNGMFYGLSNIIKFDFSKFTGKNLKGLRCMFSGCNSIISLDLSNFDTSLVTDMDNMFNACNQLKSLNLSNFVTSNVNMMYSLFGDCYNLKYLDISSFDTSLVTNMGHMFFHCESLKEINVDNFNTKNVVYMTGMFEGCHSLTSLKLDNFDTSKCYTMFAMFNDCKALTSLNLNNFDTSNVKNMQQMFANCISLTNLDISNFNTTKVQNMEETFMGCSSLISLNIINFDISNLNSYSDIFLNINNDIVYCINDEKQSIFIPLLSNLNNSLNCTDYHFLNSGKKYIIKKKIFIDDCFKDDTYQFEYNNICYISCPSGTKKSAINEYICEAGITNIDIFDNCNVIDFFNNLCEINNNENNEKNGNIEDNIDDIINTIKNGIIYRYLDSLISDIIEDKKEDLIINDNNITFQLTSSSIQNNKKSDNKSIIQLGDCERKLRDKNHIDPNDPLLIFKIDIKKEGFLISFVEYELYDIKEKTKLNIDICNDITILMPVSKVDKELFKHNSSSEYYNDICYTYTNENGNDIILDDRKNEFINNNMTLCEANCEYKGYDKDIKMSKCECGVENTISKFYEIKIDKTELLKKFVDINNIMNINILKCYKLLFSKEGLITNIGSYILIINILISISSVIIFLIKGFKSLIFIIDKIVEYNRKNNNKQNKNNKKRKNKKNRKNIIMKNCSINVININKAKTIKVDKKKTNNPTRKKKPKRRNKKENNKLNIYKTKEYDILTNSLSKIKTSKLKNSYFISIENNNKNKKSEAFLDNEI